MTALLFCFLAVGLVMRFGCADPSTQQKSETADSTTSQPSSDTVEKKIKIGLSMDSLRVERVAER